MIDRLRDQPAYLRFIGQVCPKDDRTLSEGADFFLGGSGFLKAGVAMHRDAEPVACKFDGDRPAKTLGCAGHQRYSGDCCRYYRRHQMGDNPRQHERKGFSLGKGQPARAGGAGRMAISSPPPDNLPWLKQSQRPRCDRRAEDGPFDVRFVKDDDSPNATIKGDVVIEIWSWPTPNGHKVHIALEELGLPYKVVPINIGKGDQFKPEFLAITPNHRIPAMIDPDGPDGKPLKLFESAAIMIYLSEKTGGKLIPRDPVGRYVCLQWMMFQMGGTGPMFGQYNHFANYAVEKIPYAIERYTNEVKRLHRVLDKRLAEAEYLAGREYSMADIINFPWIRNPDRRNIDLAEYPNLKRWHDAVAARPAVQRGVEVLSEKQRRGQMTDEEREIMFGKTQFQAR